MAMVKNTTTMKIKIMAMMMRLVKNPEIMIIKMLIEGCCYDAFNDGDGDNIDDELDQVKEEKEGEGYDRPPVEEDDDEGERANAEKGICKEEWGKPECEQYDWTSSLKIHQSSKLSSSQSVQHW